MALGIPFALQNQPYSAAQFREWITTVGGAQQGAFGATHFKVSQTTSASLNVQVALGWAAVPAINGRLYVVPNAGSVITTVAGGAAGHASLPRIDSVILKINDARETSAGVDSAQVIIRQGTATAGATLDNRNGAPSVGSNELLLADLLQPVSNASYLAANIRDRRVYAFGARTVIAGNNAGDVATSSTSYANVSGVSTPRIEIAAGNTVDVYGAFSGYNSGATQALYGRVLFTPASGATNTTSGASLPGNTLNGTATIADNMSIGSGSIVASFQIAGAIAATTTLKNSAGWTPRIVIREMVAGIQDNT
jgi:hypothetical protein